MVRTLPLLALAALAFACGGTQRTAATKSPAQAPTERPMALQGGPDKRARTMRQFMEATQARLKGDAAGAIRLYQQLLREDPSVAAAHFELGKLHHQTGDRRQAVESAKRAVALDKDNIWYRFLLADLYRENGQLDLCAETYRGIIARWPDRHEVYLDLGAALEQAGKDSEALKVYGDLEKRIGPNEELLMRQFGLLAEAGRFAEAMKVVQRAIEAHPREPNYLGMLAELHDRQGQHDKAEEAYERALKLDPGNSLIRGALAEHHFALGRITEAFDQLQYVFQDPDMDIDAKMGLMLGFFEMSWFEGRNPGDREALIARSYQLMDALKEAHPESAKPYTICGDFLLRDRRFTEARGEFLQALQRERDRYPIWAQVLDLDLQLGDFTSLCDHAREVTELYPLVLDPYLYLGIALSRTGRHDEAIEALITGRDLVVDNPPLLAQFWSSLGDAYHQAKRHAKSDEAFDRALVLAPDDPNILNNHAYYLSERNEQLEKAERMSRRSNELAPGQASYMDTYAWVLFRMGRYAEARTWVERALTNGGEQQGVIVEHHGDILYKLGETAAAVERWRRAKELGDTSGAIDRKINEGVWSE
jgi:tetratricopeptide (TPR) repeat protein